MHMQSILQCAALYVIVNFIVFALEQSTMCRGIGCLLARSFTCCVVRSRFSMLLVSLVLSQFALSRLLAPFDIKWFSSLNYKSHWVCGLLWLFSVYWFSLQLGIELRLRVRVHIVCVRARTTITTTALFERTINRPKANMDSALARHIPFLNLSSSFFLSSRCLVSRFIIKQLSWSFFNVSTWILWFSMAGRKEWFKQMKLKMWQLKQMPRQWATW